LTNYWQLRNGRFDRVDSERFTLETLRYPEIGVRGTGSTMFFHLTMPSSILRGRLSRFPGVDTSLPVEELRVREYKLQDGETSKFLRHLKNKCELFDSLAMLLSVSLLKFFLPNLNFSFKESASNWIDFGSQMRGLNSETISICGGILGDFCELLQRSSLPKSTCIEKFCMAVTTEVENQKLCLAMCLDQMGGLR